MQKEQNRIYFHSTLWQQFMLATEQEKGSHHFSCLCQETTVWEEEYFAGKLSQGYNSLDLNTCTYKCNYKIGTASNVDSYMHIHVMCVGWKEEQGKLHLLKSNLTLNSAMPLNIPFTENDLH